MVNLTPPLLLHGTLHYRKFSNTFTSDRNENRRIEVRAVYLPPVSDGDNSGSVLGNSQENRLREIKVGVGGLAPPSRRAEIGGGDGDYTAEARPVVHTPYLETGAAAEAIVEESSAECGSVGAIARAVQVSIPAGST